MERGRTVAAHVSGTDADDIQSERSPGLSWDQIPNKICRWGEAQLALKSERNHSWIYFMVPKIWGLSVNPLLLFWNCEGKIKKSPNIQIQMYLHPACPVCSIYSHSSHHYLPLHNHNPTPTSTGTDDSEDGVFQLPFLLLYFVMDSSGKGISWNLL